VLLILGVVNDVVPLPPLNTLPPLDAAYQSIVSPVDTLALIFTVPVPVLDPSTPLVGADGFAFTVAVTESRLAVVQPPAVASI
jgi:hypothetical protein